MNKKEKEVFKKILATKVYIIVYNDPYEECSCGEGIDHKEIKGVASSREQAEVLINRYLKKIPYERTHFDIEEYNMDGELS